MLWRLRSQRVIMQCNDDYGRRREPLCPHHLYKRMCIKLLLELIMKISTPFRELFRYEFWVVRYELLNISLRYNSESASRNFFLT